MAAVTCTRRIQFCAGHRVYRHESKCNHLHGHNYVLLMTAVAPELDQLGRVIDFGVLKQVIGQWVEDHWDHAMILCVDDPVVSLYRGGELTGHDLYVMPDNPTAENMALYLLRKGNQLLVDHGHPEVRLAKVTVWETENCCAEVTSE